MGARLLALSAALLLGAAALGAQEPAPPAADAGDARLGWYERKVCKELDPNAAQLFLEDKTIQARYRREGPSRAARVFQCAAELKDFKELLLTHEDADSLREALILRLRRKPEIDGWPADTVFGEKAGPLLEWTRKHFGRTFLVVDRVRAALWEWEKVPPAVRDWVREQGSDETAWKALPFPKRQELLNRRAEELVPGLLAAAPKSRGDFAKLASEAGVVLGALGKERRHELESHLNKARASTDALAALEGLPAVAGDKLLQGILKSAKEAGSVDETLSRLSEFYDRSAAAGAGPDPLREEVKRLRPARASEKIAGALAPKERAELQGRLGKELLDALTGTRAGDELQAFYGRAGPRLVIKDLGRGSLAHFDPGSGEIRLNERSIVKTLKSFGWGARDLLDPAKPALSELVLSLAPTFVHEAFHQRQLAIANRNGLPYWAGHHDEIESFLMETLFVIEKSRNDRAYRAFLDKASAKGTPMVQGDLRQKDQLESSHYGFRREIAARYSNWPSLEAAAAGDAAAFRRVVAALDAELSRRLRLSAPERAALEKRGERALPPGVGVDELIGAAPGLSTEALRRESDSWTKAQAEGSKHYQAIDERYREVLRMSREVLAEQKAAPAGGRP